MEANMGRINTGRVIIGGIAGGIVMSALDFVMNGFILKADFDAVNQARHIDPAIGMQANNLAALVGFDFLMATLIVFTYASIRPRFGAGPKTAFIASLIIGIACCILAGYFAATGFFPWHVWAKASAASTFNIVVAGMVGGALYKE